MKIICYFKLFNISVKILKCLALILQYVKILMVDIKDIFQTNFGDSFLDGYTLDFLESNPNPIYKNLPSIKGYRELYVTNSEYFTPTTISTTDNNFEEN